MLWWWQSVNTKDGEGAWCLGLQLALMQSLIRARQEEVWFVAHNEAPSHLQQGRYFATKTAVSFTKLMLCQPYLMPSRIQMKVLNSGSLTVTVITFWQYHYSWIGYPVRIHINQFANKPRGHLIFLFFGNIVLKSRWKMSKQKFIPAPVDATF